LDFLLQIRLACESHAGANPGCVDVDAGDMAAEFAGQEESRSAGTTADIEDLTGGAEIQQLEEAAKVVAGAPTALAEVFAVGFAADLGVGVGGEVAVGGPVEISGGHKDK
jgi:hypothetical protein